jgi:tetratricopeptide (TPR) repeat protein
MKKVLRGLGSRSGSNPFGASKLSLEDVDESVPSFIADEKEFRTLAPKRSVPVLIQPTTSATVTDKDEKLKIAKKFLFERKTSMSKSMRLATQEEKDQEQEYMNMISNEAIRDITETIGTENESDDSDDEAEPKKRVLKKFSTDATELFRDGDTVYMFDGDIEYFEDETLQLMRENKLYEEAATCLRIVGQMMELQDDLRTAYRFYEKAVAIYSVLNKKDLMLEVRLVDIARLCTAFELFEILAENYEEAVKLDANEDNKAAYQFFGVELRILAFLRGDGSEGPDEIKDRLDASLVVDTDELVELLNFLSSGFKDEKYVFMLERYDVPQQLRDAQKTILEFCRQYMQD